jgi:hypothetical protein
MWRNCDKSFHATVPFTVVQVLVRERWVAEQFLTRTAHRDQGSASFLASHLFNYITYTTKSFLKNVIEKITFGKYVISWVSTTTQARSPRE